MVEYSEELISKVNKVKEAIVNLVNNLEAGEDARIECGILNRLLSDNWNSIEASIFAEEPSELDRQIDAAIEQAYQIPT